MEDDKWWLLEKPSGWLVVLSLLVACALLGIAMDRWTALDSRAFLAGLTALGAFIAAAFAARQASLFRRDMEARLRPHIAIEDLVGHRGGIDVEIRNHGGGVAQFIRADAYLVRGREAQQILRADEALEQFSEEAERVVALKQMGSLGPGLTKRRPLFEWNEELEEPFDDWTVLVRFTFVDPTNTERRNIQALGIRFFPNEPGRLGAASA